MEGVDTSDLDPNRVAEAEGAAGATAFDDVFLFGILVGITFEGFLRTVYRN